MNRKYPKRLDQTDIGVLQTYQWPRSSGLDRETVGFIMAVQDQYIPTNAYTLEMNKVGSRLVCCLRYKFDEAVGHILSVCP